MNDAASRAEMTADLALEFARQRTHGEVFMDGRHNPLPSEMKAAERFMERLEYVGLLALSSPETTPAGVLPDAFLPYLRHKATCNLQAVRDNAPDDPDCNCGLRLLYAAPTPAGVLPDITPIPGFEDMRSAMDMFTPEERADLFGQLERLARERRAGEFEAGKLRLP